MDFPKNETELNQRLAEIKKYLPNSNNDWQFVKLAFKLFVDCKLDTEKNIRFLRDQKRCEENFNYTTNQLCGILRNPTPTFQKSFSDPGIYVFLNDVKYNVSSDWQGDCKEKFFAWLEEKARQFCTEQWNRNNLTSSKSPTPVQLLRFLIKRNTELCSLVEKLDSRIEKLEGEIEELKNKF